LHAFLIIVITIGALGWARPGAVGRGLALSTKERDFVRAAKGFGASHFYILRRHILPQTRGVILTQAAILIPQYILAEVNAFVPRTWHSGAGAQLGQPAQQPSAVQCAFLLLVDVLARRWQWCLSSSATWPFRVHCRKMGASQDKTSNDPTLRKGYMTAKCFQSIWRCAGLATALLLGLLPAALPAFSQNQQNKSTEFLVTHER